MEQESKNRTVDIVVLLAGEGRRLRPLTNDRPKALLCCEDGATIFAHLARAVSAQKWDATIIPVIGHGREKVHEELSALEKLSQFKCAYNPFYSSAGPLVSLWLGLMQSRSNMVVIVNGDTLIKDSLVEGVAQWMCSVDNHLKTPVIGLCASLADKFSKDDMKVLLDEEGSFGRAGKDIDPSLKVLKSAGVICLKDGYSKNALMNKLNELIMSSSALSKKYYWHHLLNEIKDLFTIDLIDVEISSWCEVDSLIDLQVMNNDNF